MNSSAKRSSSYFDTLPPIRRVLKKESSFVCGICRSQYERHSEANSCLNHCWNEVANAYPLVRRKVRGLGLVYRCRFCARDYESEIAGLECAKDCIASREQLHSVEQRIVDLPPAPAPARNFKLGPKKGMNHGAPVASRVGLNWRKGGTAPAETKPLELVPAQADAREAAPAELMVVQDSNTDAQPKKSKRTGRPKASYKKQWRRDSAKYVCNCCNKQYFTKVEVENCFNGHFDQDGNELPEDSAGA